MTEPTIRVREDMESGGMDWILHIPREWAVRQRHPQLKTFLWLFRLAIHQLLPGWKEEGKKK